MHAALGQAVSGSVVAGFGGYYRIGKCMPIKVHLENSGADLTGEISVQISQTSFSQAVSLPSPSRKTFVFYVVPPKYFTELEVKLYTDRKPLKVFSSVVRRVSDEEALIVKSSTLKQLLSPSNDIPSHPAGNEKAVFIDPRDFPEFWSGYDAVNSVMLDTSDTTQLNEFQRAALSRWTVLGGNVTLSRGDRSAAQAPEGRDGASFRTALGLGTFGQILGNKSEPMYQPSLMDFDEEVFKSIRIKEPMLRSGIARALGLFLFFFFLAVALCLCVPKRPGTERIWHFSVIPALAIFFSACCPLIGLAVNGGNALVRQYSILHVFANSTDVFATNDLALLFPRKATQRLRPVASSSYLVQAETENSPDAIYYEFDGKGKPSTAFRTDLGRIRHLGLADFSSRSSLFMLRSSQSTSLVNRSAYPLQHCSLIQNGIATLIGDLPAGRELPLKLEPSSDADPPPIGNRESAMLSKTMDIYQTETLAGTTGDCVICGMNGLIPSLKSDGAGLSYSGSTVVVYHLGKHRDDNKNLDIK
jgi:hypothetical protein